MSIKKGIRENVGRGKICFEYRGGRGGLCADYQFCSESLGPPIRFWWGKPNPAILVVCHGFSGKNVSKRLTRPFGPRNDIVWEFGLRCIIQFFYVEGRHVVLNRTIRLRGRGGIQTFTIRIFPMARWWRTYLIRVLELLSTEGFDVGIVLFSAGRLFIGYEILPADEKHWRLIVLAGNLIQVGFFPRNSANSRDNIDAYGRNAKLDDFSRCGEIVFRQVE